MKIKLILLNENVTWYLDWNLLNIQNGENCLYNIYFVLASKNIHLSAYSQLTH